MTAKDTRMDRRRKVTPAARAARARYGRTEKGKATARRYRTSEKARTRMRAYDRARRLRIKETLIGRPRPATCEVCSSPPTARDLHLDHDHRTGRCRGWLCHHCNVILGLADDSAYLLRKLAGYLENNK